MVYLSYKMFHITSNCLLFADNVYLNRNVNRNVFVWRNNLWQKIRKAVSAFSGPFPPLKGNVVASPANC